MSYAQFPKYGLGGTTEWQGLKIPEVEIKTQGCKGGECLANPFYSIIIFRIVLGYSISSIRSIIKGQTKPFAGPRQTIFLKYVTAICEAFKGIITCLMTPSS